MNNSPNIDYLSTFDNFESDVDASSDHNNVSVDSDDELYIDTQHFHGHIDID